MKTPSVVCAVALVLGCCASRLTAQNEPLTAEQKIDKLTAQLEQAQRQVDTIRAELQSLKNEERGRIAAIVPAGAALPAASLAGVVEQQELEAAEIAQQQQVKIESESKFPLRVTGLMLFNMARNYGVVDQVDLPTGALIRKDGVSHGSLAASLRQTWLGLEGAGPVLGGAHTSARIDLDFFGGITGGVASGPAGVVRLRTGAIRADWQHDTVEVRVDSPLISPLSPQSIATVAQPALAWAGNLWTWAPELRYEHRFDVGTKQSFTLEAGLRDAYATFTPLDQVSRPASPAEMTGVPAFEGRFAFGSRIAPGRQTLAYRGDSDGGWGVGFGGYVGKQNYGHGTTVNTWAITGDWLIHVGKLFDVSGEAYRGTGLGGLGGGAYRDVVQGADSVTGQMRTFGLDASGGWLQIDRSLSSRLRVNLAAGQDAGSGNELRSLTLPAPSNPLGYYARNRSIFGNVIYRPWNSILLSPEYRFVQSWPISGSANTAHIFTLSAGYQF